MIQAPTLNPELYYEGPRSSTEASRTLSARTLQYQRSSKLRGSAACKVKGFGTGGGAEGVI